jgi:hypothetical protein
VTNSAGGNLTTVAKPAADAVQKADIGPAHKDLLGDKAIQFDFPEFAQNPPKKSPPGWITDFFKWLESLGISLEFMGPFFYYGFWTVIIVGGLFLLAILVMELLGVPWRSLIRRKKKNLGEVDEGEDILPDAEVAIALLSDADRLAAEGRFAEAVHLLLYRSIDDIGQRLPGFLRPSLTSRDIIRTSTLPERARTTFAHIAHVVEISVFGRAGVDEAAWISCRKAYEDFAFERAAV